MDAIIVNAFIVAAMNILKAAASIEIVRDVPYVNRDNVLIFPAENLRINLGVTGDTVSGQVIISIRMQDAMEIVSGMMMGMPVTELGEMELSAISELGNMILGNASTEMANAGLLTDITPPIVERGEIKVSPCGSQVLCIPFKKDGRPFIELDLMLKKKN